ncbi:MULTISPECIES: nitrogenase iron-molybdenum cofactor biosynthesis protein NifN [unclassified Frankia]|uniref:nitrogenase iron-molybdenum cofactor biosynthesis protein NifN n=1 Tax=unclassified Frankia TaxID=2632575 RepID=UPI002AD3E3C1|nr:MULTISPECIES: nitrogenase iron-molybdenum cofactor biosynthesis protein NifN [unclassified Frankia]
MARVVPGATGAAFDPLKHSQPLGGALVFLGLARSIPLLHGAQGCTAFAKALLTRHFREPIPLQTTAVTEVSAVLGASDSVIAALDTISERNHPDVIGVLTTGMTEVNGEDLLGVLRTSPYGPAVPAGPAAGHPLVVPVSTPDFRGGLSDGWSAALEALVGAVPGAGTAPTRHRQVAVLVGPSLSAVDLDEIAGLVRAFGLDPVLVPDLSGSLDGHLDEAWSPLTTGGTSRSDLFGLTASGAVTVIGATAAGAGAALAARAGGRAALTVHDHLSGLEMVDRLVRILMDHSGVPAPEPVRRWRRRLADGLLDSHFVLGGARIALAGEPEQLVAVGSLLYDAGAEIVAAVSPTDAPVLGRAPWDEVVVGDFLDLAERAAAAGAELVVASSHGREVADRIGAAHLALGFPVYDRLGAQLRATAGYRGSLQLLVDTANCLLDHRSGRRPEPGREPSATRSSRRYEDMRS